jgi:hypothetical protein
MVLQSPFRRGAGFDGPYRMNRKPGAKPETPVGACPGNLRIKPPRGRRIAEGRPLAILTCKVQIFRGRKPEAGFTEGGRLRSRVLELPGEAGARCARQGRKARRVTHQPMAPGLCSSPSGWFPTRMAGTSGKKVSVAARNTDLVGSAATGTAGENRLCRGAQAHARCTT